MSKIYKGATGLIGNTPLVEFTNIEKSQKLEATVLSKLEYFNPAGSVRRLGRQDFRRHPWSQFQQLLYQEDV